MKSVCVILAVIANASCTDLPTSPSRTEEPLTSATQVGYHVVDLAHPTTSGNSLNDIGWASGTTSTTANTATTAGAQVVHATFWFLGLKLDLGTLGGANSAVIWPVKNVRGILSGIAETADVDPNGESWSCSAFFPTVTGHTCRGFVWERGAMRALPTLGGSNGFATGTNNRRETAGWAENTVHDPSCTLPQVLQFRAVVWGPGRTDIRELPPLGSDSTSAATALNDHGVVTGISGSCSNAVGGLSAAHAVVWRDGRAWDLGDLGVAAWNTPMAMNQRGDIVGFANAAGTTPATHFNVHAVTWFRGEPIRDLGTLPGDATSQALGVNEARQVVGLSCGATCRAFIWKDGVMRDLNELVASGDRTSLLSAGDINDLGMITGQTATSAAFIALPGPARL